MSLRILLVDDKELELDSLSLLLEDEGYAVDGYTNPVEALAALNSHKVDVVVTDLQMPQMNGIELTRRARDLYPDLYVVLVTAHATVETAVKALQEGASHYIIKSPTMGNELLATLTEERDRVVARRQAEGALDAAATEERLAGLVGRSQAMKQVFALIRSVAPHDTTVLVRGETGTGKGVAAAAIHALSGRSQRPLVTVDCASLPQTLLESELFGHVRGSFTGAHADKEGKVKVANQATLFLDEIGELPVPSQPKLLRLLEERAFSPVGSTREERSDARVVASTNRALEEMVADRRFRLDLFHRLNVVTLWMPALRERREDIPLLADYLMRRVADRLRIAPRPFSADTLRVLSAFDWPGNVRQLVHALERALVVGSGDVVSPADLPPECTGGGEEDPAVTDSLLDNERRLVARVLRETGWNIHEAARRLEISRPTLYSKIKKFALQRDEDGS